MFSLEQTLSSTASRRGAAETNEKYGDVSDHCQWSIGPIVLAQYNSPKDHGMLEFWTSKCFRRMFWVYQDTRRNFFANLKQFSFKFLTAFTFYLASSKLFQNTLNNLKLSSSKRLNWWGRCAWTFKCSLLIPFSLERCQQCRASWNYHKL